MNRVRVWVVAMLLAVPAVAAAQETKQASLEDTLWDVDQQWLCDGPYQKPYAECVKFRSQYWVDGFFEVQSGGTLRNKEGRGATQSGANPVTGASGKMSGAKSTKSPDEKLEKELSEIDQKWMDAVRTAKIDYLKQMYADKWFEILGWIPTVVLNKPMAMERVAHLNYKPGEGLFADEFKLMSVYGDVALATDRRIRKIADASGTIVSTPHRALLVFVKENGQWKVAADAAVPTMVTE